MVADGRPDVEPRVAWRAPASPNQEALWHVHHRSGASPAYNVLWRVGVHGPLERPRLERAWEQVVRRHEALRTRFVQEDGRLLQEVGEGGAGPVRTVELPAADDDLADARVAELAAEPFDLAGTLARLTLVEFGHGRAELLVCCHHSVADGGSGAIVLGDLARAYTTRAALPPATPFRVFSDEQRRALAAGEWRDSVEHWVGIAGGRAPTRLGAAVTESSSVGPAVGWTRRRLPDATVDRLASLARVHGASTFALLLAALRAVLARGGGAPGVIGATAANRLRRRDRDIVGFLANTLPVAVEQEPATTLAEAIADARATTLAILRHQHVPFPTTFAALDPKTQRGLADGPRVLLSYLGPSDIELRFGRASGRLLSSSIIAARAAAARTELTLTMQRLAGAWELAAEYDVGSVGESAVGVLFDDLEAVLALADEVPTTPVGALPIRTRASAAGSADEVTVLERPDGRGDVPDELHRIWCRTLKVDSAPPEADFFESGGHSLLLVEMVQSLASAGTPAVDLAAWLSEPTLRRLAEVVRVA